MRMAINGSPPLGRALHKVTLYLILLNLLLLLGYGMHSTEWQLARFVAVTLLLLAYQWLLVQLLYLQARRSSDGYLIYPVVASNLLLALLLMRAALIT